MSDYLKTVREFCSNLEKNGQITPIEIVYPSFKISNNGFRKASLDYVTERVRSGLISGSYGNKKFDDNITYESLLETENKINNNIYNQNDLGNKAFLEKLLPIAISKDANLDSQQINRNALADACVNSMQLQFLEIMDLKNNSFDRNYQSEYVITRDKFAATMIMLKEQMPRIYKEVSNAIIHVPNEGVKADINDLVENPTFSVVNHILAQDKEFAESKFPKQVAMLEEHKTIDFKY